MTSEIVPVKLITQTVDRKKLKLSLNGFILNHENTNHLITVHHNLPINTIYNDDNPIEIIRNSGWCEILIASTKTLNLKEYKINRIVKNTILKNNELITLKSNKNYDMRVIDYDFIPFDNISDNYLIPYIKAEFISCVDKVQGLSGSPIFFNNKLVGIFSKYNIQKHFAYIIPIYLVIKNLEKIDFTNIYCSPTTDINKINSYKVKNNMIFHPSLRINIPISTYFILEGDINSKFVIRTNNNTKEYNTLPSILIDTDIINNNDEYKINFRLLTLINKLNVNKQIIIQLLSDLKSQQENWRQICL
jgi:hypothetical protein